MKKKQVNSGNLFGMVTSAIVMLIAGILLLICYISVLFNPVHIWFITLFGLIYFPVFLINICFLLWAIYKKRKAFIIPLICLLPSLFIIGKYFKVSFRNESKTGEIKVLSYNVGNFRLSQKTKRTTKDCMDSVYKFILKENPDIICLQEYNFRCGNDVASILSSLSPCYSGDYNIYPYRIRNHGNLILSKYPIKNKGVFTFQKSSNLVIFCDCNINGQVVRIYNCHFQSYCISLSGLVQSFLGNYKKTVNTTEYRFRKATILRAEQVNKVMKNIVNSPYKSFVIGDFNDNPMSYTYHKLMKYQEDSFEEVGKGFGATYSILWPFLRVDYILFPSFLSPVSHRVIKLDYSDHYPIIATFNLK